MGNCSGQASQGAECIKNGNANGCQSRKRLGRKRFHPERSRGDTNSIGASPRGSWVRGEGSPSLELRRLFQDFCSSRAQIQLGSTGRGCSPFWRLSLPLWVAWRTMPVSPQHPSAASLHSRREDPGESQRLASISSSCGFSGFLRAPRTSPKCFYLCSCPCSAQPPLDWIPVPSFPKAIL